MRTARLLAVPIALFALGATATPAAADHVHFRVLDDGSCVLLAPDGGEKYVSLPQADGFTDDRRHPLHVNVHLGEPGETSGDIYVAYGADGVLTDDALRECGGEFVNR